MINRVDVEHFKAFDKFTVSFGESAYLVGPNSAGKSTLISTLRGASNLLRVATTRTPSGTRYDHGRNIIAYGFSGDRIGIGQANLRHEFRPGETSFSVKFSRGRTLTALWPEDDRNGEEEEPYFWLDNSGRQPRRPLEVRKAFPTVGIVPPLSPLEQVETRITDDYMRSSVETRLASRHFRNHLLRLHESPGVSGETGLDDFLEYCSPWLPEIEITGVRSRTVEGTPPELDVFYREPGRPTEKELVWAGDGVQIWLQILYHVYRLRESSTVVLDEPDLYLHADLQRRLVRLLDATDSQTITATHSAEVLAEASQDSIIWVDKSKRRGIRSPQNDLLSELSSAIGSQFNLKLARALRSKAVFFVEGKDMRLLSLMATAVNAPLVAAETEIAVIGLGGFDPWKHIPAFSWLVNNMLEQGVPTFVALDRDYRCDEEARSVCSELESVGVSGHVWHRKELESYLLDTEVMARVSGASEGYISEQLGTICSDMEADIFSRMLEAEARFKVSAGAHRVTITSAATKAFKNSWRSSDFRVERSPAKDVLHRLNSALQGDGWRTLSPRKLAASLEGYEVADEVRNQLLTIEAAARGH